MRLNVRLSNILNASMLGFLTFFISGCANMRVWGDNMLRGWKISNQQDIVDISNQAITYMGGDPKVVIWACLGGLAVGLLVGISIVSVFWYISRHRALKHLFLYPTIIENSETIKEAKKMCKIVGLSDKLFEKRIQQALKPIRRAENRSWKIKLIKIVWRFLWVRIKNLLHHPVKKVIKKDLTISPTVEHTVNERL